MANKRPLVFVDLDDTLFQSARKMADEPRHAASVDLQGAAIGFMRPVQKQFVEWLLTSADVVPVTARSVEAYLRVQLPFSQGAICAHGGAILGPDGSLEPTWHGQMSERLAGHQVSLPQLCAEVLALGETLGISLRGWVVEELGLANYVVIKHNEDDDEVLARLLVAVRERNPLSGLYVHRNGNNLAFLPECLRKRTAVQEWIRRDRLAVGERPLLGFGDSLSDLGFLGECDWWGTPSRGQLAAAVMTLDGGVHA
ncbi:MAG: trehalose phosphatase [Pseudomonas sp.]|uniref:trehalose phosphatase n=1 Tax=Pseudomonas sp. TaxID=306 RepID=UPI003393B5E6